MSTTTYVWWTDKTKYVSTLSHQTPNLHSDMSEKYSADPDKSSSLITAITSARFLHRDLAVSSDNEQSIVGLIQ